MGRSNRPVPSRLLPRGQREAGPNRPLQVYEKLSSENFMIWLKGKKTYIVSGLMVLTSLIHLILGEIGLVEFFATEHMNTLLEGLGLSTLRAGVAHNTHH
jgi:hypothetical protein